LKAGGIFFPSERDYDLLKIFSCCKNAKQIVRKKSCEKVEVEK
jgi:hypothetical protein